MYASAENLLVNFSHNIINIATSNLVIVIVHLLIRLKCLNKNLPTLFRKLHGLRNELGRLSVKLQITTNILKFWIHLENQPPDSIAKLCLNTSDKMAQENKSGLINKINLYVHNSILMRNQLTLKTLLLSYQKLKIIYQYILKNTKSKFLISTSKKTTILLHF